MPVLEIPTESPHNAYERGKKEEREACAKIADAQAEWADKMIEKHDADPALFGTIGNTANDIAEAIRERGDCRAPGQ